MTNPGMTNQGMTNQDMQSFRHVASPLRLFSGPDCLGLLGKELERAGAKRAVIFCGRTMAASPLIEMVKAGANGRCVDVFPGVRAHSPHLSVVEGADFLRQVNADAVIALGGGSPVVTARAAAIYLAEGADPKRLATQRGPDGSIFSPKLNAPKLPQFVIPTTPNTATVKAGSAIRDPDEGQRYALFDPKTRAQAVFVHPDMIMSCSRALVISSSLDTLILSLEGLTAGVGDPFADALLVHTLRLLAKALSAPDLDNDVQVRADLMYAALLGGRGTDHASAGIATALGHAVGASEGGENGVAKSIVLPHTIRFNAETSSAGLDHLAFALGASQSADEPAEASIHALVRLFKRLGLPQHLRELGFAKDRLGHIAEHAMGDWFMKTNVRKVTDIADLEKILNSAW